jgi:hypothetical protein
MVGFISTNCLLKPMLRKAIVPMSCYDKLTAKFLSAVAITALITFWV